MKTWVLVLSLLGNIAVAAVHLAGAASTPAQAPLQYAGHESEVASSRPKPAIETRTMRRLALAELEERELGAIENPWDYFWRPEDPSLRYAAAVRAAYERVRHELERRFGPDAARSPEFARAFRPLDAEASFLSSAEQLELQRRRLDARPADVGRLAGATPSRHEAEVRLDFLLPAAAFELRLRSSPLASLVRASGAALDEAEFRGVFSLLDAGGVRPDLQHELRMRRELRDLLGSDRAATVLAARDPVWPVVQRTVAEQGLDISAAKAAYMAASDAQQALLELAAVGPLDGSAAAQAGAIAEAERSRLVAALGESGAATLIAARDAMRAGVAH